MYISVCAWVSCKFQRLRAIPLISHRTTAVESGGDSPMGPGSHVRSLTEMGGEKCFSVKHVKKIEKATFLLEERKEPFVSCSFGLTDILNMLTSSSSMLSASWPFKQESIWGHQNPIAGPFTQESCLGMCQNPGTLVNIKIAGIYGCTPNIIKFKYYIYIYIVYVYNIYIYTIQ